MSYLSKFGDKTDDS